MDKVKEIDFDIKRKPKITCIERKYKITDSNASYIVTAKREFDENVTRRLLHEDMELKTFLANYDITSISIPITDAIKKNKIEQKTKIDQNTNIEKKTKIEKKTIIKPVNIKPTIIRKDVVAKTMERRELFDSLDLPDEFTTTDYEIALEEKGATVTNPVMANDDFRYFVEIGKIERTGNRIKRDRAYAFGYRKVKSSNERMIELNV